MIRLVRLLIVIALITCNAFSAAQQPTVELHTPGGVISTTTDIHVEGIVTTNGDYTLNAVVVVLKYDPDEITISNPRSATGWDSPTTNDDAVNGYYYAVTCSVDGLSANGPIVTLAITPVGSSADLDDCDTLEMIGGDAVTNTGTNISVIRISDGDYISIYTAGSCGNRGVSPPTGGESSTDEATTDTTTGGESEESSFDTSSTPDLADAATILRLASGFEESMPDDLDSYDRNGDEQITLADAVILLRTDHPYVPKGWYTFQGNRGRTGRAMTPVDPDAVQKWTPIEIPTVYSGIANQVLQPSVLAVPNPANPSYPVVFAVVTDGETTSIYRIIDVAAGTPSTPLSYVIQNENTTEDAPLMATGTPLVLTHGDDPERASIIIVGNAMDDGNPVSAHVYRVDVNLTGTPEWTLVWHRSWPGSIYASPAFYAGPLEYTKDMQTDASNIITIPNGQAVIVAANETVTSEENETIVSHTNGYLFAMDIETGGRVWGLVDEDGNQVPTKRLDMDYRTSGGLYPFASGAYLSTESSPVIVNGYVYANDSSCFANARDLIVGEYRWEYAYSTNTVVHSTMAAFEGSFFYGQDLRYGSSPSVVAISEESSRTGADSKWEVSACPPNLGLSWLYATPAIHAESRRVIFADIQGIIHGVSVDRDDNDPIPDSQWTSAYQALVEEGYNEFPDPIFCSPLIAGYRGEAAHVFIGSDNGNIYVLDAESGANPALLVDPLNGMIRSSMATYNGRLYVLTNGYDPDVPTLYCLQ